MPDFTNYSNFNKDAALSTVKYGSNALILEVEFNEAQLILDNKISTLIKDRFGNGFYKTGSTLVYAAGTATLSNDKAFVEGNILQISTLALALAEGESAYLDVWQQEVTFASTLKKYGNQQEALTVTNLIKDSRITEETTRRTQNQYSIVKTTGVAGHTYLPLCTITGGVLVDNRVAVGSTGSSSGSGSGGTVQKLYSSFTAISNGTTNCPINLTDYDSTIDVLDVFYEGAKQNLTSQYSLNANKTSIDLTFPIDIGEVIHFEVLKNVTTAATSLAMGYFENNKTIIVNSGVVTIGISQYNPTTDLLIAHVNSVFVKSGVDYTVTGTGITSAINIASGTWNSGTEFDFMVIKSVVKDVTAAVQTKIDALQTTATSTTNAIINLKRNLSMGGNI